MKTIFKFGFSILFLCSLCTTNVFGADPSAGDYAQLPLSLTQDKTPMVMLAMSNDHQLFYRAYSDYTDLDGDGVLDYRYKDSFDYSGYFDSKLCYGYNDTDDYFYVLPESQILSGRLNEVTGGKIQHSCGSGWSGNFLNWISMSRMDVLRSTLYGGKRSTDHTSVPSGESHGYAILERAYLPNDVHSFGRVYEEYDEDDNPDQIPLYHVVDSEVLKNEVDKTEGGLRLYEPITLCSTTSTDGRKTPILRVVNGSYPAWTAKERSVCDFSGTGAPPETGDVRKAYVLRVEVCKDDQELGVGGRCKRYSDGTNEFYKPVGVLQRYGDNGRINFGLVTGSYHKNTEGGIVRSEVHPFAGNADSTKDEIDLNNGAFRALKSGVVSNIDKFEIVNYSYASTNYGDCNTFLIPVSSVSEQKSYSYHCSNWGNPISEIYYETLRYFAGNANALSDYYDALKIGGTDYLDSSFLSGLNVVSSWTNPYAKAADSCAKCAIILISSGPNSFDQDVINDLNGDVPGLVNASSLTELTKKIGQAEFGEKVIGSVDGFCVEKDFTDLSAESGICPDQPQTLGTYNIAGLAFHAKTTDISSATSDQKVNTYAIELADSVPALDFNINGSPITITPACQSKGGNGHFSSDGDAYTDKAYSYCSITDVRVLDLETVNELDGDGNVVRNLKFASIVVIWENSQWGNDHDMDAFLRIDICTNKDATCKDEADALLLDGQFKVTHQVVGWSLGSRLRAAYSVTGSTSNGLAKDISGNILWSVKDQQANRTDDTFSFHNVDPTNMPVLKRVYSVSSDGKATQPMSKPLFLAAKYGGYSEKGGEKGPDLQSEWDELNNDTGEYGSDGLPDNYFQVKDPSKLNRQLNQVFTSLIERVSSGSSAAVVANRASGNGAIYQAIYYPKWSKNNADVTWVGQLHSLFIDDAGLIREDSDGDAVLDDYPIYSSSTYDASIPGDYIVDIYFVKDDVSENTYFQRYAIMGNTGPMSFLAAPVGQPELVSKLKPIWNAADQLASLTESSLKLQRDYDDTAASGRYIFTTHEEACDQDNDGLKDETCVLPIDFVVKDASGGSDTATDEEWVLSPYLGFNPNNDLSDAKTLINYIRGVEYANLRSRKTFDDSGNTYIWRLGDIVHSTPLVVEPPNDRYDSLFSDKTYEEFQTKYKDRRRMVYVGANDGMIHAFNGGYWSTVCNGFYDKAIDTTATTVDCSNAAASEGAHPLGSEMWAYIPRNLLPHLRWLTLGDYPHVFYVDGEPQAFDVRIFEDDDVHPNGWGTILVVPMRTGGGAIEVDLNSDGTAETTMRSSIVVLDVTNPNDPPTLVAEISDPNLGLTVSSVSLLQRYFPAPVNADGTGGGYDNPGENNWYLAFGNGPSAADVTATISDDDARLFVFDLKSKALYQNVITGEAKSFVPSLESVDWDLDGGTDSLYLGTVRDDISAQKGKAFRWNLTGVVDYIDIDSDSDISPSLLMDAGQPMVAKPKLTREQDADRWVHFGTGRFYANADQNTTNQQTVYGIREPRDSSGFTYGTILKSGLMDTTNIRVLTSGDIYYSNGDKVVDGSNIPLKDTAALTPYVESKNGWKKDLTYDAVSPSGRVLRSPIIYQDQIIFTEYLPSGDQCDVLGRSLLYNVSWKNGVALPYNPLNNTDEADFVSTLEGEEEYITGSVELGVGEFSGTTVYETNKTITLISSAVAEALLKDNSGADQLVSDSQGGNCVFVQSSTGALVCQNSGSQNLSATGRQSWREVPILF